MKVTTGKPDRRRNAPAFQSCFLDPPSQFDHAVYIFSFRVLPFLFVSPTRLAVAP
jgi:hypothetical protein